MKKFLKRVGIIFIGLIGLIVALFFLIPILFKSDIQEAVNKLCKQNIDAEVALDLEKFNLSIFSNFPNITASINDFEVVGHGEFSKDTLITAKSFSLSVNVFSMLFGDTLKINGIYANEVNVFAHKNKRGKSNWDIYKGEEAQEDSTDSKTLSFLGIDEWKIEGGNITYYDQEGDVFVQIHDVNHKGSGVISDNYVLNTLTSFGGLTFEMDGVTYLKDHAVESKLDAHIDSGNSKFSFADNFIQLNKLKLSFDGDVVLKENNTTGLNLTFSTNQTDFKEILSLIPSIYQNEEFEKIKTKGVFALDGKIKGDIGEGIIPTFSTNLIVKEGFFQYPDLPKAIQDINFDLNVQNMTGKVENTLINLKNLHLNLGNEAPIDAYALIKNLTNTEIDAGLKGKLSLESIADFYPIKDLVLKGVLDIDAKMKGKVNPDLQQFPYTNIKLDITNGYAKSANYPAIENLKLSSVATAENTMSTLKIDVNELDLLLDGEHFAAKGHFENLEDLQYDIKANGLINLEKILNVFPVEGMTLKGLFDIDHFYTKGKMSDITNENYIALESGGQAKIKDFFYEDKSVLPMSFVISSANLGFVPHEINVSNLSAKLGNSDLHGGGEIYNYMGYAFSQSDTILNGRWEIESNSFDVDEWMVEDESTITTNSVVIEETGVAPIPQNLFFNVDVKAKKVIYDGMDITDVEGRVILKEGICSFERTSLKMFGSLVELTGNYNTKNPSKPKFEFNMGIEGMEIGKVAQYFEVAKKYLPNPESISGRFSGDINYSSALKKDYMPDLATLNALGDVKLFNTSFNAKNVNILSAIQKAYPLGLEEMKLHGTKIKFFIEDGKLRVEPFDVKNKNTNMKVSLVKGFDGVINHKINVDAPAAILKQLGNDFFNRKDLSDRVNFDLLVKGTELKPLVTMDGKNFVKNQISNVVNDEINKEKEKEKAKILAKAKQEADKIRAEGKKQADKIRAESQSRIDKANKEWATQVGRAKSEGYKSAQAIEDKASNVIERRIAKIAADKVRLETDKKVVKLKSEGAKRVKTTEENIEKQAQAVENVANKQADKVEVEAQKRVDSL